MAQQNKPQIIWHKEEGPQSNTSNTNSSSTPKPTQTVGTKITTTKRVSVKQQEVFDKIVKALSIVYCVLIVAMMFLPDAFAIDQNLLKGSQIAYTLVRWFSFVPFVALPLAAFSNNRTIKNVAIYFTFVMVIFQAICVKQYMADFVSSQGMGLATVITSTKGLNILHNYKFRLAIFIVGLIFETAVAVLINIRDKHLFDVTNWKEWLCFVAAILGIAVANIPIYVPVHLFGVTEYIFRMNSAVQYIWFLVIAAEIVILYLIFRRTDEDVKWTVVGVLSIANICQFMQLFGADTLLISKIPLYLCNITTFLINFSIWFRNKRLFGVTSLLCIVGCLFALIAPIPHAPGTGAFMPTNIHYMAEHAALIVIPILAVLYNLFPRFDKRTLLDTLLWYSVMTLFVWILGTAINTIYFRTGNLDWQVNWMFLFDSQSLINMAPFLKGALKIRFRVGNATIYPFMQLGIYVVLLILIVIAYYIVRLLYLLSDKIKARRRR